MIRKDLLPQLATVNSCTLCGSCSNACPTGAISFTKSYLDFQYPQIDAQKCVGCKSCVKKCPVLTDFNHSVPMSEWKAFIAKNTNDEIREKSTSGGVFYAAAQQIIKNHGYVCGAVIDKNFQVKHICSNKEEDIFRMMGSKYAQSNMGNIFQQVQQLIKKGIPVLFTGCPCQIAGLQAFLEKKYHNLILMEVICHGIPSNLMLQNYVSLLSQKKHSKVIQIEFRNKHNGWHSSSVRAKYKNGKTYDKITIADAFMKGMLQNIFLKSSCYACKFRPFASSSDCMVGDFWGAEVEIPEQDDNRGLSVILIHNKTAEEWVNNLGLSIQKYNVENIIKYNMTIIKSPQINNQRETFYKVSKEVGYQKAIDKLLWEKPWQYLKRTVFRNLRAIRNLVKGENKPLY